MSIWIAPQVNPRITPQANPRITPRADPSKLVQDILPIIWSYLDDVDIGIIKNNTKFTPDFINYAINYSTLGVVKWVADYYLFDVSDNYQICERAAKYNRLDILQWAFASGYNYDKYTCIAAAENGHIETLQWLRANKCEWDDEVCAFAALNGHFDLLKWARANNCPWDKWTVMNAIYNSYHHIADWAIENGCSMTDWGFDGAH